MVRSSGTNKRLEASWGVAIADICARDTIYVKVPGITQLGGCAVVFSLAQTAEVRAHRSGQNYPSNLDEVTGHGKMFVRAPMIQVQARSYRSYRYRS